MIIIRKSSFDGLLRTKSVNVGGVGPVAKTPAFQAGDPGSNPGRRTSTLSKDISLLQSFDS